MNFIRTCIILYFATLSAVCDASFLVLLSKNPIFTVPNRYQYVKCETPTELKLGTQNTASFMLKCNSKKSQIFLLTAGILATNPSKASRSYLSCFSQVL